MHDPTDPSQLEDRVDETLRQAFANQDYQRVVTTMLDAHGAELRRYIRSASDPKLADDIYGQLTLDLWRDIRRFQWRCSVRTYLFTLARHAVARTHKLERRARRRERVYAEAMTVVAPTTAVEPMPTTLPAHLRTDSMERFRQLRSQLSTDDQALLTMRIDRCMSYKAIAIALAPGAHPPSDVALQRGAARLRKRFQALKARLRAMMEDDGEAPARRSA